MKIRIVCLTHQQVHLRNHGLPEAQQIIERLRRRNHNARVPAAVRRHTDLPPGLVAELIVGGVSPDEGCWELPRQEGSGVLCGQDDRGHQHDDDGAAARGFGADDPPTGAMGFNSSTQ